MDRYTKYAQNGKRYIKESPKGKSPSMTSEVRTIGESKEANKGKHLYISAITGGAPRENLPSKGTMKRKFIETIFVIKKDASTLVKIPHQPILGFWDSEYVGGIPNEFSH